MRIGLEQVLGKKVHGIVGPRFADLPDGSEHWLKQKIIAKFKLPISILNETDKLIHARTSRSPWVKVGMMCFIRYVLNGAAASSRASCSCETSPQYTVT